MEFKNCLICESKETKEMMTMCSTLEEMLKRDEEFVKKSNEICTTLHKQIDDLKKDKMDLYNFLIDKNLSDAELIVVNDIMKEKTYFKIVGDNIICGLE